MNARTVSAGDLQDLRPDELGTCSKCPQFVPTHVNMHRVTSISEGDLMLAGARARLAVTTTGLALAALRASRGGRIALVVLLGALLAGGFAAAPVSQWGVSAAVALPTVQKPNIVLFLTDDMRSDDLKYLPKTCHLLGGSGVTFAQSVSPNPLCCPARAELVTAQYTHNNGAHSNAGAWGGMQALKDPDNNIGVWLQDAGYRTALVGKYLNGYEDWRETHATPAGWDRFDATIKWIYEYNRYQFESYNRPTVLDYTNTGLDAQGRSYITRAETQIVDGYIDDFAGGGQPFFLFDSLLAPHGSQGDVGQNYGYAIPEPRYADLYAGTATNPATESAAFLDQSVGDVPMEARSATPVDRIASATAKAQSKYLQRIRALASVDDHVAAVIQKLKDAGQFDNTVFIFTSDNGYMLGEHNHMTKFLGYQESLRVPLIISGPGFPQGVTSSYPVTTVDVSSTILDLAGAAPGRLSDGQSILAKIHDSTPRPFPIEGATSKDPVTHEWGWQGAAWGRYSYMRYWNGGQELYDTTRSRWQEENLVDNPRYAGVLGQMRTLYTALRSCQGTVQCNPPASVPPAPRPQYQPRFSATLNRPVLHAAGHRAFRIHVQVAGHGVPVDSGTLRMLADGRPVGPRATVTTHGHGIVRWDPPASKVKGAYRLAVRYNGADKDVTAGLSRSLFTVRVR